MELSLTAPVDGRVREVLVSANAHVDRRAAAAEHRAARGRARGRRASASPSRTPRRPPTRSSACSLGRARLRRPDDVRRIVDEVIAAPADPERERRLLETYADVRALNRPHPTRRRGSSPGSPQEHLHAFLRSLDPAAEGLPDRFVAHLERAVAHYGIEGLERTAGARGRRLPAVPLPAAGGARARRRAGHPHPPARARRGGDEAGCAACSTASRPRCARREPALAELARELRWRVVRRAAGRGRPRARSPSRWRSTSPRSPTTPTARTATSASPRSSTARSRSRRCSPASPGRRPAVEAMTRRYYRIRTLERVEQQLVDGVPFVLAELRARRRAPPRRRHARRPRRPAARAAARSARTPRRSRRASRCWWTCTRARPRRRTSTALAAPASRPPSRASCSCSPGRDAAGRRAHVRAATAAARWSSSSDVRGLHPMMAERMELWRLSNFELERLPAAPDVYLFSAVARENERDERLVALAEVRDLTPVRDDDGRITALPELERMVRQAFEAMRSAQSRRPARQRLLWNRLVLYAWPRDRHRRRGGRRGDRPLRARDRRARPRARPDAAGAMRARRGRAGAVRIFNPAGRGVVTSSSTTRRPSRCSRSTRALSGSSPPAAAARCTRPRSSRSSRPSDRATRPSRGEFVEHDLDEDGELVPVDRPPATNARERRRRADPQPHRALPRGHAARGAARRPDAVARLAGRAGVPRGSSPRSTSPSSSTCRSSGSRSPRARRSRWTRAPRTWTGSPRRCAGSSTFTQAGGEINVVVTGINVGAQPYFNAEATMLMHTRGILVMTPDSAMVLTGKQALDYSGGVSAEDNFGIGGYDRVMGPNGQAQYWAPDLAARLRAAPALLRAHLRGAGRALPAPRRQHRPADRDISGAPHEAPDSDLETVGAIFSRGDQPGPQEAVRHPLGDARGDRPRRRAARALGGDARGRDRRGLGRAPGRPAGGAARHRVAAAAALRQRAGRRSRAVDVRHAVPGCLEEDRSRDQRGVRPPAAGRARQPGGLRRLAGVDAPAPARVRRRDRPRDRQLRRPDRVLRDLALPRRRVRRVLAAG